MTPMESELESRGRPTRHPILHTLSAAMRGAMIAHLDGPQLVVVESPRHPTMLALVRRHLLRLDGHRPARQSFLTDKGRDAAGACAEHEVSQILELEAMR